MVITWYSGFGVLGTGTTIDGRDAVSRLRTWIREQKIPRSMSVEHTTSFDRAIRGILDLGGKGRGQCRMMEKGRRVCMEGTRKNLFLGFC